MENAPPIDAMEDASVKLEAPKVTTPLFKVNAVLTDVFPKSVLAPPPLNSSVLYVVATTPGCAPAKS